MSRSAPHGRGLFVTARAERDGCVIVVLRGALDVASAPALREKVLEVLRPGVSRLIIDLSAVGSADASGFAVLVGIGRRAGLLGGWLRLASPTPEVARVLSATGLDRHLATFPTVTDATAGRYPDAIAADAGTGVAGHVAPIRPVAALPARRRSPGAVRYLTSTYVGTGKQAKSFRNRVTYQCGELDLPDHSRAGAAAGRP